MNRGDITKFESFMKCLQKDFDFVFREIMNGQCNPLYWEQCSINNKPKSTVF